jgi:WD40 repeat protein
MARERVPMQKIREILRLKWVARILTCEGGAQVRHAIHRAADGTVKVIDVASDREVGPLANLAAESVVVAASQDGRFAVTRDSGRRSLTVWDLKNGVVRYTIDHPRLLCHRALYGSPPC